MPPVEPNFSLAEIESILQTELEKHPQARLADLFKLLNQACYGPTHMDPDPEKISENLRGELKFLTRSEGITWQDLGCGQGFYRINLTTLDRGDETVQILTNSILASRLQNGIDREKWRQTWEKALPLLLMYINPLPEEYEMIDTCLHRELLPSHSEIYKRLYDPHYRVVWHAERVRICKGS